MKKMLSKRGWLAVAAVVAVIVAIVLMSRRREHYAVFNEKTVQKKLDKFGSAMHARVSNILKEARARPRRSPGFERLLERFLGKWNGRIVLTDRVSDSPQRDFLQNKRVMLSKYMVSRQFPTGPGGSPTGIDMARLRTGIVYELAAQTSEPEDKQGVWLGYLLQEARRLGFPMSTKFFS